MYNIYEDCERQTVWFKMDGIQNKKNITESCQLMVVSELLVKLWGLPAEHNKLTTPILDKTTLRALEWDQKKKKKFLHNHVQAQIGIIKQGKPQNE